MNVKFIGTAAFEGFPGLFCSCPSCLKAFELGGKNLRTRSGAIINGNLLLDVNPDLLQQRFSQNLDLQKLEDILVTHNHEDHFNPQLLLAYRPPFSNAAGQMHVYITAPGVKQFEEMVKKSGQEMIYDHVIQHEVTVYQWFETSGGYSVFPVRAEHSAADSVIYLVKKEGKTALYGTDTGLPGQEAFDKLKEALDGNPLDLAILDCTNGLHPVDYFGHMGLPENIEMKNKMLNMGIADGNTMFAATHFSHCLGNGVPHSQMETEFAKQGIEVAFDGLEVRV